jgi:hypothetical protein
MKKQPVKKLAIQKETLTTHLDLVAGGSQVYDTVYRFPAKSANCVTAGGGSYA